MVGRLVEEKDIGGAKEQPRERQPALLATRKHFHFLVHIVTVEKKRSEQVSQPRHHLCGRALGHVLEHGALFVEVVTLLAKVPGLDVMPELDLARIRRFRLRKQTHERRLTHAVRSHQRHPLAAFDDEIGAIKDAVVVVALVHALELDDDPTGALHFRQAQAHQLALGRHFDLDDLLQHLDPALYLLGLGRLEAKLLDEAAVAIDLFLLPRRLGAQLGERGRARF